MTIESLTEWNDFLLHCPDAHLLQSGPWGELKSNFGWEPVRLIYEDQHNRWGTQILFRKLPLGITFAYLPKGPLLSNHGEKTQQTFPDDSFWSEVDRLCRKKRAVFLKIEPDVNVPFASWQAGEVPIGFSSSSQTIQPPRTIVIDLRASEEEILARMKQKTRYNIRLASKKGVTVRSSDDIAAFYSLMEVTGKRDQFGIHSLTYYQKAFDLFYPTGNCVLLAAESAGQQIAGMMAFAAGRRAWYLYGASASLHRELMPTYLLQWEAIRWARSKGCWQYDLYGVPDHDQEYLEANFKDRSDGLWGIYRFKRGFGGQVVRSAGPWDRVYNALLYRFYLQWTARSSSEE
jgi:peptidoglycan pentaglycine glycine transferase (the first glycine)